MDFLRSLKARGLDRVKLTMNTGLKGVISQVIEATWQRYRVQWMCNAWTRVSKAQNTVVAAAIR